MAKKLPASSRPERLVSLKAEDILGTPLSRQRRADLARLKNLPDSEIDFSDIPPLSDEQLAVAFQPKRQLIAVRLDREILDWLRAFGPGYSTRINNILRVVMENSAGAARQPLERTKRHPSANRTTVSK